MSEPPRARRPRFLQETVRGVAFFIGISVLSGLVGAALIGLLALLAT